MFDDRVYKRGALTLHALRRTVGDSVFFELLAGWVASNRHGCVTTEAFRAHVENVAGAPARVLLDDWLFRAPLPGLPAATGRRGA